MKSHAPRFVWFSAKERAFLRVFSLRSQLWLRGAPALLGVYALLMGALAVLAIGFGGLYFLALRHDRSLWQLAGLAVALALFGLASASLARLADRMTRRFAENADRSRVNREAEALFAPDRLSAQSEADELRRATARSRSGASPGPLARRL
jgi:hypothetical protein